MPDQLGVVGVLTLALGLLIAVGGAIGLRRRDFADRIELAATVALLVAVSATPYLIRRVVEDLRTTTAMSGYDRDVAGPVQAYLQPYLLDRVKNIIPANETYATVVGNGVPYATARRAFPSLALESLFPRISVDLARADWVIAWGANPGTIRSVGPVIVARPASGAYPALLVARRRP